MDANHLYNAVSTGQQILLKDAASQAQFGESELQLDLGTTVHEIPYATFRASQYLQRFKDLEYMINARILAFFSMDPGEVACFKFLRDADDVDGYLIAMQVMSVQTQGLFTTFRGRQVSPSLDIVEKPDISRVRATDGASATFFADGAGGIVGWYGDERYINTAPYFDVEALDALTLVQYNQMEAVVFPAAKSPIGNPIAYSISALEKGFVFNTQTRTFSGTPNVVQGATDHTYTATDTVTGETATLTQSITVLRGRRDERPITDGDAATFFVDGAGGIVGWYGH